VVVPPTVLIRSPNTRWPTRLQSQAAADVEDVGLQ
jgi:hypothetical protein